MVAALTVIVGCERDTAPVVGARLLSSAARARVGALFVRHCAICHGDAGDGRGRRRAGFESRPADFTSTAWRSRMTPAAVFDAIRNGKRGTSMPAWRVLADEEIVDLTAYVLSLAEAEKDR